ncbi:WAS/WASL-interacting protein family member 3-like [Dasypus novemcinctus]|uniref:WAS/WASL-interacting protein family member 3-like n=1 Tax=Dasypus novemcinctus TaxID=9361 RepID=UPI00265EE257|nr:WAS/WASL-interacting protein family member 3-like [Dasypus novemcinctus]
MAPRRPPPVPSTGDPAPSTRRQLRRLRLLNHRMQQLNISNPEDPLRSQILHLLHRAKEAAGQRPLPPPGTPPLVHILVIIFLLLLIIALGGFLCVRRALRTHHDRQALLATAALALIKKEGGDGERRQAEVWLTAVAGLGTHQAPPWASPGGRHGRTALCREGKPGAFPPSPRSPATIQPLPAPLSQPPHLQGPPREAAAIEEPPRFFPPPTTRKCRHNHRLPHPSRQGAGAPGSHSLPAPGPPAPCRPPPPPPGLRPLAWIATSPSHIRA